jgi:hypothetical protein
LNTLIAKLDKASKKKAEGLKKDFLLKVRAASKTYRLTLW